MEPGEAEPPAPKVLPPSIRSRMPPRQLCFASSYAPFLCVFVVFAGTMSTQDSTLFCWEEANEARAPIVAAVAAVSIVLALSNLETAAPQKDPARGVLDQYCVTFHNEKLRTAGLALDKLDVMHPNSNAEVWERVIEKLRAGSMPPPGRPRPDTATYRAVATWLEHEIDRAWTATPNPGRIGAVHRLNRTEYSNAIRDLLGINADVRSQLPGDETADGSFDNFADSLSISTAHLERYLSVARQVTRLATGLPPTSPTLDRFEMPLHVLHDERH